MPDVTEEMIDKIKIDLNPVFMKQILFRFSLEESITVSRQEASREYTLTMQLLRNRDREKSAQHLSRKKIIHEIEQKFVKILATEIFKRSKEVGNYQQIQHR